MTIVEFIKRLAWAVRYRAAVSKADRLAARKRARYMVVMLGGRIRVVRWSVLRDHVRMGEFKKGVTMGTLASKALHITD